LDNFDVTLNNFSKNVETLHQEIRRRAQTKTKDKSAQNIDIFGKTRNNYERKRVMTENDDIFKEDPIWTWCDLLGKMFLKTFICC